MATDEFLGNVPPVPGPFNPADTAIVIQGEGLGKRVVQATLQSIFQAEGGVTSGNLFLYGGSSLGNIAALRANTVLSPIVMVSGYTTVADGGQGQFILNTLDTTSADNGGTIIVDAVGHRYYRITPNLLDLNVKWFGAKGNGSTEDTVAILRASTALTTGGTLIFPSGIYPITLPATGFGLITLLAACAACGVSSKTSIIKILSASPFGSFVFANPIRTSFGNNMNGAPATTPANQTDIGFGIFNLGFDFTAANNGNICSFLLAQRIAVSQVEAIGSVSAAGWSGLQFIGCDVVDIDDYTAVGVTNAIDAYKGCTRVKVNGFNFEACTSAGNGGLINFNGLGTSTYDGEHADDFEASNGTLILNSSQAMLLDPLSGGSATTNVKLSNVQVVAKSGSCTGILGRGAGGKVSVENLTMVALSGATLTFPIEFSGFYDYAGSVTAANLVTTSNGSASFTLSYPGSQMGVGDYVSVSAGGGNPLSANGMSLNGFYPITAASGTTLTVTGPNAATSSGTVAASTNVIGYWGCFKNVSLKNITFDNCGATGSDLITLGGSGHVVDGVIVTENYFGSTTPAYRAVVSIDGSADIGNATPQPSIVRNVLGAAGAGSLNGYAGNNVICWNTVGAIPDVEFLDVSTPTAPAITRNLPVNFTGGFSTGMQGLSVTPQLQFGGAHVGMSTTVTGEYTLMANICFFTTNIVVNVVGSSTGIATITSSLPGFAGPAGVVFIVDAGAMTGLSGAAVVAELPGPGSSTLYLNVAGTNASITNANFQATSSLAISGWFFTS